jgi:uncharacterized protein YbjT (DUF2867 family)
MFAITGITGQVGGQVARTLLGAGQQIRAVVRDPAKGEAWAARGCEVALADMNDASVLRAAFAGVDGVFVLLPPQFDPSPDFRESRQAIAALHEALAEANPAKVVCLSTIGAQATQPNLLSQLGLLEQTLRTLPMPVAFLRAGWFMENSAWDIEPARRLGLVPSYLQPGDKPVAMVATADVAQVAAELLQQTWQGSRIVELEGPGRITPDELAATLGRLLEREVRAEPVPRATWEALFKSQGMRNPVPRMQMLDGFNAGWIEFEGGEAGSRKGEVTLETVLRELLSR